MSAHAPASWLTMHRQALRGVDALDVACGRGRHALWLAEQGYRVTAIDRDADVLRELAEETRGRGLSIVVGRVDLEGGSGVLPADAFDVIVVVHYLHRPLFPQLLAALRPGGVLVYETFTTAQAARGKPTNPDFLLRPGELRDLVGSLDILAWREGEFDGRDVASVVARKTGDGVAQKTGDGVARKRDVAQEAQFPREYDGLGIGEVACRVSAVPEPASAVLVALGVLAAARARSRRSRS